MEQINTKPTYFPVFELSPDGYRHLLKISHRNKWRFALADSLVPISAPGLGVRDAVLRNIASDQTPTQVKF